MIVESCKYIELADLCAQCNLNFDHVIEVLQEDYGSLIWQEMLILVTKEQLQELLADLDVVLQVKDDGVLVNISVN